MPDADNEMMYEIPVRLDSYEDYSEQIKAYRKEHHLLQHELAQIIGVSPYTLRAWEQGQTKPPYHKWRLLLQLFNKS